MARAVGLSQSAIVRIWHAFGLKPHRVETFKLSTDPYFVEKVRDVVGLYMSPPENAIVLSVDEKSQVQALDRTQPLLPMSPGQAERRTHDYLRHGTTSLFAALNVATGQVIGRCYRRHRQQEFLKFLKEIDAQVVREPGVEIHVAVHRCSNSSCTEVCARTGTLANGEAIDSSRRELWPPSRSRSPVRRPRRRCRRCRRRRVAFRTSRPDWAFHLNNPPAHPLPAPFNLRVTAKASRPRRTTPRPPPPGTRTPNALAECTSRSPSRSARTTGSPPRSASPA